MFLYMSRGRVTLLQKVLLIASYLASYNSPKSDKKFSLQYVHSYYIDTAHSYLTFVAQSDYIKTCH